MRELPKPFDNDDEDAATSATGLLNEYLSSAPTHDAQNAAIRRLKRFLEHERDKRARGRTRV